MRLWLGLTLAFISAITVNWAYAREHDAATTMPPFSPRQPVRFFSLLLGNRRWLVGFAAETGGWLVYVAALRLAPISLVQAICASGIAVLAFATAHGHPARLARHEQSAVVIAFAGLVLLSFSLVDTRQVDHSPEWAPVVLWLGCSAAAALTLARAGIGLARGPARRPRHPRHERRTHRGRLCKRRLSCPRTAANGRSGPRITLHSACAPQ
jgi:hypothetical protein